MYTRIMLHTISSSSLQLFLATIKLSGEMHSITNISVMCNYLSVITFSVAPHG